jgi:hypothetical protein
VCRQQQLLLSRAKVMLAHEKDGTLVVPYIQSSTRAIVRMCLRTIPGHIRSLVDRLRTSLALDTTPVPTYLPRSDVEATIGRLLEHDSPSRLVSECLTQLYQTSVTATNQSQQKADAVKSVLALAVVASQ